MAPRIAITHGFHPSELTEPYANEAASALMGMGYDVSVEKVPFGLTCWGVALAGFPQRLAMNACYGYNLPTADADIILDFHTADEQRINKRKLPAKCLPFLSHRDMNDCSWSGITYQPWLQLDADAPHENGHWIEVPQRYKPTPAKFTRAVLKANPRFESERLFTTYFSREGDGQSTLHRYPPEVIAEAIARGVEEKIIKPFLAESRG